MDKPPAWQTWLMGMLIVSACSFTAPLGMLILPCLSKKLYERIMIFLIALGIGALSGSTLFIMLPQAFHPPQVHGFDHHSKSAIVVGALYVFFTVDRILQYGLELRRRRQAKRKVHTSTIASILNNSKTLKNRNRTDTTISTSGSVPNSVVAENNERKEFRKAEDIEEKEKAELAEEVEIAMMSNAFARTFSTRRRLAVMNSIDGIELTDQKRRGSGIVGRNSFVEAINNDVSRNQDHFLELVHSDVSRGMSGSQRPSLSSEPPIPLHTYKKDDDEVSVSVKIVEKHVIDPSTIEVASVAYMIIFGSSAAFSDSILRGLSIGFAVVSQQFPQELGLGFRRTMLYNMIPIFLSYLGFVCGVLLDSVSEDYDEYIFSVSSGMYLYIFLGTLIPEIREGCNELMKVDMKESLLVTLLQYLGITSGICFMYYMSTVGDEES
ncbi:Zrt (ZRT) Irt-(IRT-) like Protein Transporter [Trichostrongylus colubriformis]|uniref:Zrt (ZRT) Irt-(IRT-) like Protein Transporter n=1 Tax=Trichostrongylus colubriformis TaxID=6319 RepID=A0AAN8IY48_TRICO